MKLTISIWLILLVVPYGYAQYAWDKGYFVNNNGERTDCLIRRLDGEYNPKKMEYKSNESSEPVTLNIADVKEFGVIGEAVFIRATVNIDRSSLDLNKATSNRNPDWTNETLFLKLLVRGEANLYVYKEDGLTRFLFNTKGTEINQLIYKAFYPYSNQVAYNKTYLEQLKQNLSCDKMPQKIDVPYQAKPLESLFRKYNECMGVEPDETLEEKEAPVICNLNFRPGINFSTLSVTAFASVGEYTANFSSKVTGRVGFEFEIYPAFNNRNKKWSVTVEPNYRYYSDEFTEGGRDYSASYKAIELPIGLRKYFYLANHNSIFLNINIVLDYPTGNSGGQITVPHLSGNAVLKYTIESSGITYAAGVGFSAKRLLTEIRLYSNRNLTQALFNFSSDFSNVALVLGYRLLK